MRKRLHTNHDDEDPELFALATLDVHVLCASALILPKALIG
jgi:hypothetical protein